MCYSFKERQGLEESYTCSVTSFLHWTTRGPNFHTRVCKAMQSALARCLSVGWDAHSHMDQNGGIGVWMERNLSVSRILEKGSVI